jgi:hypothetical protein
VKSEDTVPQLAVDLESTALSSRIRRKTKLARCSMELSQSFFQAYIYPCIALATVSELRERR